MSQISSQIRRHVTRANQRLCAESALTWVPLLGVVLVLVWTDYAEVGVAVASVGCIRFLGWTVPRLRQRWVGSTGFVRDLDKENHLNGLVMAGLAVENGSSVGSQRWGQTVREEAITRLRTVKVPVQKMKPPIWGALVALVAVAWVSINTLPTSTPEDGGLPERYRVALEKDGARIDAIRDFVEDRFPEAIELLDDLRDVQRALDPLVSVPLERSETIAAMEDVTEAITTIEEEMGTVVMAEILAALGAAAEFVGDEPIQQLQQDLKDAAESMEGNEDSTEERGPKRDEGEEEPPPEAMKPSEESSEEGEDGEADEEVMAKVRQEGIGEETEGSGKLPETLLDEAANGSGTVSADAVDGGEVSVGRPEQRLGGSEEMETASTVNPDDAGSIWVEAQWSGDPAGHLRAIEMMDQSRSDPTTRDTLTLHYRSIAEANVREAELPANRAAYIQRYFKRLASKESP